MPAAAAATATATAAATSTPATVLVVMEIAQAWQAVPLAPMRRFEINSRVSPVWPPYLALIEH